VRPPWTVALLAALAFGCTRPMPPGELDASPDASGCTPDGPSCPSGSDCRFVGGEYRCVTRADIGVELDAGTDAPRDAPRADTPPDGGPTLPAPTAPSGVDSDLGCVGSRTAPVGGTPATYSVRLRGVVGGGIAAGVPLSYYPDDLPVEPCTAPCISGVTDGRGALPVTGPMGGWFAFRNAATATFLPAVSVHLLAGAGVLNVNVFGMSVATRDTVLASLGVTRTTGTAVLFGTVRDCAGAATRGAVIRLLDASGAELVPPPGGPLLGYFDGAGAAAPTAIFTATDGQYFAGNVPLSAGPLRVEAWANVGGGLTRIACETIPLVADGASVLTLGPLRTDYALGDGCR
jgi:hypothetical protein